MKVAIFSLYWARQNFSAASVRTFGLIHSFLKNEIEVNFVSSAKDNKSETAELDMYQMVKRHHVKLDDPISIKNVMNKLKGLDIAIFDTFVAEEFFSHLVHTRNPQCLKILDLQDFHSLRKMRHSKFELLRDEYLKSQNLIRPIDNFFEEQLFSGLISEIPDQSNCEIFARELASMIRSDLVLSCSDYELEILKNNYAINNTELITFFYDMHDQINQRKKQQDLKRRKNFVWLGNQTHAPNEDSLRLLVNHVWPKIHERLPEAQLHIYGSNFQREFSHLERFNNGIKSCGLMDRLSRLQNYRIMLAPLRFGGGIKGKISDSWYHGLPVATSPIGAEGMFLNSSSEHVYGNLDLKEITYKNKILPLATQQILNQDAMKKYYNEGYKNLQDEKLQPKQAFGGLWNTQSIDDYVEQCVKLYTDEPAILEYQQKGYEILDKRMSFQRNEIIFQSKLSNLQLNLNEIRKKNFLQQVTWSETLRSTENLQKYITEKGKKVSPK